MNEQQEPRLLEHEADGIQELDNLLPRWWLWLFYLSIVFSVLYMGYFHVLKLGGMPVDNYNAEVAAVDELHATGTSGAEATILSEPTLDAATLAKGKTIFTTHCLACHGMNGEGLVGPNFTDDYYIHGPTFADSVRTAMEGVPAKGMISWKLMLKQADIHAVSSYIWTLRGTSPPNGKAPEGEKFEG